MIRKVLTAHEHFRSSFNSTNGAKQEDEKSLTPAESDGARRQLFRVPAGVQGLANIAALPGPYSVDVALEILAVGRDSISNPGRMLNSSEISLFVCGTRKQTVSSAGRIPKLNHQRIHVTAPFCIHIVFNPAAQVGNTCVSPILSYPGLHTPPALRISAPDQS